MENNINNVETGEVKVIEIFGREIKTNNTSFIAYRAKKTDGTLIDCSFTKDCNLIPKFMHGFIIVRNSPDVANISKTGIYPRLWIKEVIECREFVANSNPLGDF